MKRILLTGMSGTGKSTLIQELGARGYKSIDMDEPGWSEFSADGDWIWREDRVAELGDGFWVVLLGQHLGKGSIAAEQFHRVSILYPSTKTRTPATVPHQSLIARWLCVTGWL
jgi:hypothetical protein